jgi:3-deoxy-manno-octulosonate cytidylyltransferase (CMP-KDO synthetase)
MKVLGVIPARYESTRFPGKPLALIQGKPMIQHVYRGAGESTKLYDLVVATDDKRIVEAVKQFGGKAVMTSPHHVNGTGRCTEVAALWHEIDWVINIQGDEPMISGTLIDEIIHLIEHHPAASIITLVRRMDHSNEALNPNVVKCVFDQSGKALYFSRSPIPYYRTEQEKIYYQHLGIYAYKRDVLIHLNELAPTPLESAESLEQLRWLEHGLIVQTGITEYIAYGVDVPEDLHKVENMMKA